MEILSPQTVWSPEAGPSSSTDLSRRPNHYLLIDTQGVPYTALVGEECQREQGAVGASAQKKCYSCPVCSRVFEYMSYLQRHRITHSEVKPFACDTCGKTFKRASHLARHCSIHRAGGPGGRASTIGCTPASASASAHTARAASWSRTHCRSTRAGSTPEPGCAASRASQHPGQPGLRPAWVGSIPARDVELGPCQEKEPTVSKPRL